jgi:glycogen(starch) synthase
MEIDDQLAERLNHFKLVVVPSIGPESFGLVALEGIACGCAVIASDIGGLKEAVGPCGVTVPPADANALAEQIRLSLTTPGFVEKCQANARDHLEQFTIEAVATKYLNVFSSAVQMSRRPTLQPSLA